MFRFTYSCPVTPSNKPDTSVCNETGPRTMGRRERESDGRARGTWVEEETEVGYFLMSRAANTMLLYLRHKHVKTCIQYIRRYFSWHERYVRKPNIADSRCLGAYCYALKSIASGWRQIVSPSFPVGPRTCQKSTEEQVTWWNERSLSADEHVG